MSVQLENGYTQIANELIEQFAKLNISGREWQILFVILRKTYGYKKKNDNISLSQFEEATGIKANDVSKLIKKLESKNIIGVNRGGWLNSHWLNKQWLNWLQPVAKQPIKVVAKQPHTKERKKTTKEIYGANAPTNKIMYNEPTIELNEDGEEIIPSVKRTTYGRMPAEIAKYYCELVGKTSASAQLPAAKEILQLHFKDYPEDTDKEAVKEIQARIDIAEKHYVSIKCKEWGLRKVAENWEKILTWK